MKKSFITSGPDLAMKILLAPFGIMPYFQHINVLTLCMLCAFHAFVVVCLLISNFFFK